MTRAEAAPVWQVPKKPRKPVKNLIVINGSKNSKLSAAPVIQFTVSQLRLARIQDLQSRMAFTHAELRREWREVRKQLMVGAQVETGPLRAWLEYSVRVIKKPGQAKSMRTHTTLIVR
jgi:hypothetical protein